MSMLTKPAGKKIVIGMSGGVDSSVGVALLKKEGYEIHGVFLRLWKSGAGCKQKQETNADEKAVRAVAKKLQIKFRAVDARTRFKKEVVGYFLEEYATGRTPNPCVFCNENFKFKILFEEAKKIGVELVATGHYARSKKKEVRSKNGKIKCQYRLFEAKDKNKDQSYFLYRLKQKQLAKIIFPLGEYEKTAVRKLAKQFDLPVSEKKESQDICFLCEESVSEFLKKNLKLKKGEIVDGEGKIIGQHNGLALYTLGQRKGINIGGTGPYFVVSKNSKKNRLIVSNKKEENNLFSEKAVLEKISWIFEQPQLPFKALVRTRYRNLPVYATITEKKEEGRKKKGECRIVFEKPQRAVTPGQSTVFYTKSGEVLGGGIIK